MPRLHAAALWAQVGELSAASNTLAFRTGLAGETDCAPLNANVLLE
jgi:hypothetical protein